MARTRETARRRGPPRLLVVSLLIQNPTAAETTTAPAPAGVTTRARSRRLAAATAALPEEILVWEIFVRLPANHILRCRTVCRYWRRLTSAPDFLLAHHRRQPSLLLLTRYGTATTNPIFQRGHPILGFNNYNGFKIHASCDGLLLLSLHGSFSVCNPATRQCAPLQCLNAAGRGINTAALYQHRPSGEYCVLYWRWRSYQEEPAYCILMMRRRCPPRCIGVPSDTTGIDKAMLAWNEMPSTDLVTPIVFRNCLHWDPSCLRSGAGILVFDTEVESFRLMRGPADATKLHARLCDMEGSIGFGCFGGGSTVAKIWVLEDYEREVWSFKYHVELPMGTLYNPQATHHLVLSHKGDVLLYNRYSSYMYHCDNTGKLLDSWSTALIGPWFKESLVKHDFFQRRGCARVGQQRFFENL